MRSQMNELIRELAVFKTNVETMEMEKETLQSQVYIYI
jgi:hypothetical protein